MLQQLLNHIERHKLCKTTDKILLAVSGGIDSMVMLELFTQAGYQVGVAHCNFQLRGAASDADEILVQRTCARLHLPFHVARFDTELYSKEKGVSIQMAARELRYNFFNSFIQPEQYQLLATAHHLNDDLETVILNLTRGTGIEGIAGIKVKTGHVIRPLLFATREMIHEYAKVANIEWREDASNQSDDYQRNLIRHHVLPRLSEINPNLAHTFRETRERIQFAATVFASEVSDFIDEHVIKAEHRWEIKKNELLQREGSAVLLWEVIKEFGFNFRQCQEIVAHHIAGKKFLANDYQLVIDRQALLLEKIGTNETGESWIHDVGTSAKFIDEEIVLEWLTPGESIAPDNEKAFLDGDRIQFPLRWRRWMPGDFFKPLGMSGEKKVSDFLIDKKISMLDKEHVSVIESAGKIAWIVGHRIHDDFKITPQTTRILMLKRVQTIGKKKS